METLFRETQRFDNKWVRLFICLGAGALAANFGAALYQRFVLGVPGMGHPLPDWALAPVSLLLFSLAGALVWMAFRLTLVTTVDQVKLTVRMFPLLNRTVPLTAIVSAQAVNYHPLREYGGWGLKWGGPRRGWAYSISGRQGVRLELRGGRRILVGSSLPRELSEALNSARLAEERK